MIIVINEDGEKEEMALYCGRCGRDIYTVHHRYGGSYLYYAACKCGLETPLFKHQLSAVKYYKDNYGLTREK